MPFNDVYRRQVDLLVRTLPYVAEEECFALKGGTAINLFVRDLPRLSVDIDLTYLPIADRDQSLAEIGDALRRISVRIQSVMKGIRVTESTPATQQTINKLILRTPDRVQIKIEMLQCKRCLQHAQRSLITLLPTCLKIIKSFWFPSIGANPNGHGLG